MKTRRYILALFSTLALSFTSCSSGNIVNYEDGDNYKNYVKELTYHNNFNILQISDIHWSTGTDQTSQIQYIKNLIKQVENDKGKIDLIEVTGDVTMLSNKGTVTDFLTVMSSFDIPFATIWGNHDRESTYSADWLTESFRNAKNSLYTEVYCDNVYGTSNYVINLKSGDETKWQIVNLDSGSAYNDSAFAFGWTYDYIREDQVNWWKYEHDKVGKNVPVVAYYHIVQQDMEEAWKEYEDANYSLTANVTKAAYSKFEKFASSEADEAIQLHKDNKNFFDVGRENGLKGIFSGHAHSVDWTCTYKGVTMGLGVKTGKELYYYKLNEDEAKKIGLSQACDMIGASLVTLHDDKTFDLSHLYFNDIGNGYFAEWVNY